MRLCSLLKTSNRNMKNAIKYKTAAISIMAKMPLIPSFFGSFFLFGLRFSSYGSVQCVIKPDSRHISIFRLNNQVKIECSLK